MAKDLKLPDNLLVGGFETTFTLNSSTYETLVGCARCDQANYANGQGEEIQEWLQREMAASKKLVISKHFGSRRLRNIMDRNTNFNNL